MTLKASIVEDMKTALKAGDKRRLGAIRLLLAAIKQKEVDERVELGDAEVLAVVDKLIKQRKDSIAQYSAAKRQDLVDAEQFEADVLAGYLPRQLSEEEISAAVAAALQDTGAKGMPDMGKVMGLLKGRLAGRADLAKVSALVKSRLAAS